MRLLRLTLCVSVLCLGAVRTAPAQELPILDPAVARYILQEVSGDAAYEHVRFMTQFHRPGGGADGLWRVAEYYETKARALGLTDVRLIKQADDRRPWNATFADLWLVEPAPERVASTLHMRLFDATLHRGVPRVPQRATDVTQYTDCRWGTTDDLRPAARRGSLCCRLALESVRPAERAAAARQRPER